MSNPLTTRYRARTNKEYLFSVMSDEELAQKLIGVHNENIYDYDNDDNLYICAEEPVYMTSDGQTYWDYDEAIKKEVEWLNAPPEF